MIFNSAPTDWKDLQNKVYQIFLEIGCETETEKNIPTVRGNVEIDVYVRDNTRVPNMIYLCECKNWDNAIPQTVIHALQTVVNNAGANLGYIISKKGFQRGAYNASECSNIELLSFDEFQKLFFPIWLDRMCELWQKQREPISIYYDPWTGPPRDAEDNIAYEKLCKKYYLLFDFSPRFLFKKIKSVEFPIKCINPSGDIEDFNEITIENYRDLFDIIFGTKDKCIEEFEKFREFLRVKHGRD